MRVCHAGLPLRLFDPFRVGLGGGARCQASPPATLRISFGDLPWVARSTTRSADRRACGLRLFVGAGWRIRRFLLYAAHSPGGGETAHTYRTMYAPPAVSLGPTSPSLPGAGAPLAFGGAHGLWRRECGQPHHPSRGDSGFLVGSSVYRWQASLTRSRVANELLCNRMVRRLRAIS